MTVNPSLIVHLIQIKNGIIKHVNASVKMIVHAKKIIVGILAHVFVFKTFADTSVIACEEIIFVKDIVSTKMTNNISRTMLINSGDKTDFYILYTVSSAIILLLIITIVCYDYAKHRSRLKGIDALTM